MENTWRLKKPKFVTIVAAALVAGLGFVWGLNGGLNEDHVAATSQKHKKDTLVKADYALVNGLEMYYEIHGRRGRPLVLLHGGFSNIQTDFADVLPALAKDRRVIAIEVQGHGHTADIDRPFTYEQLADDTVALLDQLNIEQADYYGYSLGGGVAMQAAIRHPQAVRKLVVISSIYKADGFHPEVLGSISQLTPTTFVGTPIEDAYKKIAPKPEQLGQVTVKVRDLLLAQNWSPESVRSIKAPTFIAIGDSDNIRLEHATEMFGLLGGGVVGDFVGLPQSQLAVFPATTHFGIPHNKEVTSAATKFLDHESQSAE
ncbi:MAG: alpha/beta hydrolase [Patescibacteria group bacterium]